MMTTKKKRCNEPSMVPRATFAMPMPLPFLLPLPSAPGPPLLAPGTRRRRGGSSCPRREGAEHGWGEKERDKKRTESV